MTLLHRQLRAKFGSIITEYLKGKATAAVQEELIERLVAAVPIVQINPLDEGRFFYHGALDEGHVVNAEHEIRSAHMNLPRERKFEITLSTASLSIFAASALIWLITSLRADRRWVRVHSVGWVSAATLAVVQSADERTIDPSAFVLIPSASSTLADEDGMSPDAAAYKMFVKHYVEQDAAVPTFWERYPTSGLYLSAGEAVAHELFDAVMPISLPQRRGNVGVVRAVHA